jgi:hypothetical protein
MPGTPNPIQWVGLDNNDPLRYLQYKVLTYNFNSLEVGVQLKWDVGVVPSKTKLQFWV